MKLKFTLKKRLLSLLVAIVTVFSFSPATPAFAYTTDPTYYSGGQWYAMSSNLPVYDSLACTNQIGTIYSYEGFTVLNRYGYVIHVEYSTSSGTKRGYVYKGPDELVLPGTCVAEVTQTSALYYGPSTTVNPVAGYVYAGEFVTILAKNDDWVYVEYNTTQGRKRGHMSYSHLHCDERPNSFPDLYTHNNAGTDHYYSGTHTVYAGPSSRYAAIGTISNEWVTTYYTGSDIDGLTAHTSTYIEYNVSGYGSATRKSGWIVWGP